MDQWDLYENEVSTPPVKKMLAEIQRLIPGYIRKAVTPWKEDNTAAAIYLSLTREYKEYEGGKYFLKSEQPLVHFTSFEAALKILGSGEIWSGNLGSLNDPREFIYGTTHYGIDGNSIAQAKKDAYSFSFCLKDEVIIPQGFRREFTLWRLYGADGEGIMFEFEIANERRRWKDFYLSKVHYGVRHKRALKKIHDLNTRKDNIDPPVKCDISPLLFFHKSRLYDNEYEVKLIYDGRPKAGIPGSIEISFPEKKVHPLFSNNGNTKCFRLPLFGHSNFTKYGYFDEVPVFKITRITLGYKNRDTFKEKKKEIEAAALEGLGYIPKIELSHLTKTFYGPSR